MDNNDSNAKSVAYSGGDSTKPSTDSSENNERTAQSQLDRSDNRANEVAVSTNASQIETQSNQDIIVSSKQQARSLNSDFSKPGAIRVSNQTATQVTHDEIDVIPKNMEQLKGDVEAKQKGRNMVHTTSGATYVSSKDDKLGNLQRDIDAKKTGMSTRNLMGSSMSNLQSDINAKKTGTSTRNLLGSSRNLMGSTLARSDSITKKNTETSSSVGRSKLQADGMADTNDELVKSGKTFDISKSDKDGKIVFGENDDARFTKKEETALSGLQSGMEGNLNGLVSGEYGIDDGLAVAVAIEDEDGGVDSYLPSAVEFDPDAKPPMYRNRRFCLLFGVMLIAAIVGTIGAVVGITLTNDNNDGTITILPYRATIGIRENVERIIPKEKLDDVTSPYRKALDWITYIDPLAITPDQPKFMQRFIMAYFYFATSIEKPWDSGCAPSVTSNQSDRCNYIYIRTLIPDARIEKNGYRWLSGSDECGWAGIDCDDAFQIQSIELGGMGMSGTFPEGIVWLPYLQRLIVGFDQLKGPLPTYIGNQKNLYEISLPGNQFTGTIPNEWFESRSIRIIDIENNQITGSISSNIQNHLDLQTIKLRDNLLTGMIPEEIGNNINLLDVIIDGNSLNGTFPSIIGRLEHLKNLDISRNLISGTIPQEIGQCTKLGDFFIHTNLLTGKIPEALWKATNIRVFDVSYNNLTGPISGKITTLSNLVSLSITNNQFTGSIPPRIGQTEINYILASGNKLNGTVAPQLCDLIENKQLQELEFDCSPGFDGSPPEIICPTDCCTLCCNVNGMDCVEP